MFKFSKTKPSPQDNDPSGAEPYIPRNFEAPILKNPKILNRGSRTQNKSEPLETGAPGENNRILLPYLLHRSLGEGTAIPPAGLQEKITEEDSAESDVSTTGDRTLSVSC